MEKSIFQSRLLQSAKGCAAGQMPEDYSAQYDEFVTLAKGVLYSDRGFHAIEELLEDALAAIEDGLKGKKKCCLA